MLISWLVGAALFANGPAPATKTCPDGSVILANQRCLTLPDHRAQFSLAPETTTNTIAWSCQRTSALAKIRITEQPYVNDKGERIGKYRFKVELLSLEMNGQPPSAQTIDRVRAAVESLNGVSHFYGGCFLGGVPQLNISGHVLPESEERWSRIELLPKQRR